MPRQEDELQLGMSDFLDQQEDEETDSVLNAFRKRQLNDLEFTWQGESDYPGTEETLVRAFELAGRAEVPTIVSPILAKVGLTLIEEFSISDASQRDSGDTRFVSNKYGDDYMLQPGKIYFIHQI